MNHLKKTLLAVGASAMLLAAAVPAFAAPAAPVQQTTATTSAVCPHGIDCPYNGACTRDCGGYGCSEAGHTENCPNRTASAGGAAGDRHTGGHHSGQGRHNGGGRCRG